MTQHWKGRERGALVNHLLIFPYHLLFTGHGVEGGLPFARGMSQGGLTEEVKSKTQVLIG